MATYQFGAVGATGIAEGTYGLLQSFSKNHTSDEAVAQDADGNVADQHIYNKVDEITCEYVFDTTTTLPSVGDTVSVGSDHYTVMSVNETESNTDYKKAQLTLKRYVNNSIPSS